MKILYLLLFPLLNLQYLGCGLISDKDKKEPTTFYNSISGWDIRYVPIIKPFRVSSIDGGRSWLLNKQEISSVEVSRFGVSQNFIYGYGNTNWFVFDTKSKLYATYLTEDEMDYCLKRFNVKKNEMTDCNDYFGKLEKGITPYWFPAAGKEYPDYPAITPKDVVEIKVVETPNNEPDFELLNKPEINQTKIYFFRILYSKQENDLYYFSFSNEQPILIKDSLLIPVFNASNKLDITMYTPYPVAEKKGIPENKRFWKQKKILL